jgi:8-oxo-dGTP diphosphatase
MTRDLPVDVAVGVVLRADGAVLLGQRPAGKPYAGWWEFPGGKLERGESVHDALVRELDEELGLRVRASLPWVVREFVYPHAKVRLHFRRVFDFDGEPSSREGQSFVWRMPGQIDVAPLLPATIPVLGWLNLPHRCARSAVAPMGAAAFLAALDCRLREGALDLLALDEPQLAPTEFAAVFHPVVQRCHAAGVQLLVGSAHPASFARAAGGVLLTTAALHGLRERPAVARVVACVTGATDLAQAAAIGADCAWIDPRAQDSAWLADLIESTHVPVYVDSALASVDARSAGAHDVVHSTTFWGA